MLMSMLPWKLRYMSMHNWCFWIVNAFWYVSYCADVSLMSEDILHEQYNNKISKGKRLNIGGNILNSPTACDVDLIRFRINTKCYNESSSVLVELWIKFNCWSKHKRYLPGIFRHVTISYFLCLDQQLNFIQNTKWVTFEFRHTKRTPHVTSVAWIHGLKHLEIQGMGCMTTSILS